MATGFRHGNHPAMELLLGYFPDAVVRLLRHLTPVCAVVFFGIVCWFGLILIQQQIRYGEISPSLQVGMWVTTLPLILGSALAPIGAVMNAFFPDASEAENEPEKLA
jgi:TRAP-type C4-dicarboxylate transport system permease small subunit